MTDKNEDKNNDMNKVIAMPDVTAVNDEASSWVVLLEDGDLSAEDRTAFLAWREASEIHREAFGRLAALWDGFDQITVLEDYASADDNVALLAEDAARARRGVFGRRAVLSGIAASFVALVSVVAVYQLGGGFSSGGDGVYQTAIGEQQTIELPDGSTINLNTNSRIEVDYSAGARDIRLASGEAFFEVAHDPARPFSVWVGDRAVTAIGTAFTVRLREDKLDVTVARGRVALFTHAEKPQEMPQGQALPSSRPAEELGVGQRAIIAETVESVETIGQDALARKLSWREGVLAFSGDPLSDVIADVSRYTDITIEIENEALAALPVSGYFRIGEVEEMFEALEIMAGLKAERLGDKRVRFVEPVRG